MCCKCCCKEHSESKTPLKEVLNRLDAQIETPGEILDRFYDIFLNRTHSEEDLVDHLGEFYDLVYENTVKRILLADIELNLNVLKELNQREA